MVAEFNKMQSVKRRFFAMRNGVVADTLRRGGSRFRIIFGLNLPQIVDIAREIGHDDELAAQLWENRSTRESRLLAPMIMAPEGVDVQRAIEMCADIDDVECADVFCHRFLRRHPEAARLVVELKAKEQPMMRYIALRLLLNVLGENRELGEWVAEEFRESEDRRLQRLAAQIAEEVGGGV